MIFPKKPVSQSRNNNYAIILLKHMKMKMHAYIKKKRRRRVMHTVDGGGKMEPKMLVEEDEVVEGSLGPKR